jgi:hypothetical protein
MLIYGEHMARETDNSLIYHDYDGGVLLNVDRTLLLSPVSWWSTVSQLRSAWKDEADHYVGGASVVQFPLPIPSVRLMRLGGEKIKKCISKQGRDRR